MTTLNQQEQNVTNLNNVEQDVNMAQLVRWGDAVAQQPPIDPMMQLCTVTFDSLNIRTQPNTGAPIVTSYPLGTVLNFIEVTEGEQVDGNPHWGHSVQDHYYWMGGTDRP